MICSACPRKCNADRNKSVGFCLSPDKFRVARAALHYWEEPCISGENGSGTVFFSGCNLRCVYCQNYEISRENKGLEISDDKLIEIFESLIAQVQIILILLIRHTMLTDLPRFYQNGRVLYLLFITAAAMSVLIQLKNSMV